MGSQLIAKQVERQYQAHDEDMCLFLEIVRRMEKKFKGFTFIHIPRTENSEADSPAKQASLNTPSNPDVFHDTKATPAISGAGSRDISNIEVIDCRQPLEEYLNGTFELTDAEEKRRIERQARSYTMIKGHLYKACVCALISAASPRSKAKTSYSTFMVAFAVHTLAHECCVQKPITKGSIGP
jgi:hypothetical protein